MMWISLLPLGIRQKSLLIQGIPCSIENLKNKRTKKNSPMQFKRCKEMLRDSTILQECLCWSTWSMTGIIQLRQERLVKILPQRHAKHQTMLLLKHCFLICMQQNFKISKWPNIAEGNFYDISYYIASFTKNMRSGME